MHGQNDYNEPRMRTAGSRISGRDLFIKVTANKRRVHEQEPVLLTYKGLHAGRPCPAGRQDA